RRPDGSAQARRARAGRDSAHDEHRGPLRARPGGQAVRALLRNLGAVPAALHDRVRGESGRVRRGLVAHRPSVPTPHGCAGRRLGHGRIASRELQRLTRRGAPGATAYFCRAGSPPAGSVAWLHACSQLPAGSEAPTFSGSAPYTYWDASTAPATNRPDTASTA